MRREEPLVTFCLVGIAATGVGLAILRSAIGLQHVDETTLWLLGISVGSLIVREVKRIKWGDKEIELFEGLQNDVNVLKAITQQTSPLKELNPTSGQPANEEAPASAPKELAPALALQAAEEDPLPGYDPRVLPMDWESDPNMGRFGRKSKAGGWELTATVRPLAGKRSAACLVDIEVRSTDTKEHPPGHAWIYLHPTYGHSARYQVVSQGGVVKDQITAWGAFTVGVITDDKTPLELDLHTIKGGTPRFYDN